MKGKWEIKKLVDISTPRQWSNIPMAALVAEGYPVYGANGIIGKYVEYNHEKPTLAITCRGATCGNLNITLPYSYISSNAMALDDLSNNIDLKFLYYALKKRGLNDVISGSAQPQITRECLGKVFLRFPPLDEQKRIAAILDTADAIRAKRKAAIANLDELAQSVFLEMFGDPVRNEKGWEDTIQLGEMTDIVSGITKGRIAKNASMKEVPYLAVSNVQDRHLILDVVKTIMATDEEIKRYKLEENDLLLTEGGDPDKLGRGTLWNNEIKNCIHQNHIFRVRVKDKDKLNPLFLEWLIGSTRGKRYFLKSAKQTTGIASINLTQLKGFPLLLPPYDRQLAFESRIKKIEVLKSRHQSALVREEALFASLQHRAFAGEL